MIKLEASPSKEGDNTIRKPEENTAISGRSFSRFESVKAKLPDQELNLQNLAREITSAKWKRETQRIRQLLQNGDSALAEYLKYTLPGITIAGLMNDRKSVKVYTQLGMLDLDNLPEGKVEAVRKAVNALATTVGSYVSPSGKGLKVIYHHTGSMRDHRKAFDAAVSHYCHKLKKELDNPENFFDESVKDVNRLNLICFDPDAYFNFEASPLAIKSHQTDVKAFDPDEVAAAKMAVTRAGSPDDPKQLMDESIDRVTASYRLRPRHRNNFYYRVACEANRFGVPLEYAEAHILEHAQDRELTDSDLPATVRSAYSHEEEFGINRLEVHHALEQLCSSLEDAQLGDARQVIDRLEGELVYVDEAEHWYAFDGQRWQAIAHAVVRAEVAQMLQRFYQRTSRELGRVAKTIQEAGQSEALSRLSAEAARRAKACGNSGYVEGILCFMKGMLNKSRSDFDTNVDLFNLANGTLELQTLTLRPHEASDYITKLCPVEYNPDAVSPKWDAFLDTVFQKQQEIVDYVMEICGAALDPRSDRQALYCLIGRGANGKTTLLNVMAKCFGEYHQQAPAELLIKRGREGAARDALVAQIAGARLVTFSEIPSNEQLNESFVKTLTGGDLIEAKLLYQQPFRFVPQATFFIAGNHELEVEGTDDGIWRRLWYIEMKHSFLNKSRPMEVVLAEFTAELPGILNRLVAGLRRRRKKVILNRPVHPQRVEQATNERRFQADQFGRFLAWYPSKNATSKVPVAYFYAIYDKWCCFNEEKPKLITSRHRLDELRKRGYEIVKSNGKQFVRGFDTLKGKIWEID